MREGDALFEIIKPGATTGCPIRVAAAVIEIVTALEGARMPRLRCVLSPTPSPAGKSRL